MSARLYDSQSIISMLKRENSRLRRKLNEQLSQLENARVRQQLNEQVLQREITRLTQRLNEQERAMDMHEAMNQILWTLDSNDERHMNEASD